MADGEILHERLSATEGAVLQTDERIDELEETVEDAVEEVASLEERILACLTRLEERLPTANTQETEELRSRIADLEREQTLLLANAGDQGEPEPEPIPEETILTEVIPEEVEPETESASAGAKREVSWWEKFLTLR